MIQIINRDDKVIVTGIPEKGIFPAKALRFEEPSPGRASLYNTWEKEYIFKNQRVEVLQNENGDALIGQGQSIEQATAIIIEQAQTQRSTYLWAEENGDLRDNSSQWSHGNGAAKTNNAMVILRDGHLSAMGLNVDTAPQSTCVVLILINDKVGGYVVLEAGQRHVVHVFDRPVAVKKGDRARFYTYLGGKAKIGTVNAEITE